MRGIIMFVVCAGNPYVYKCFIFVAGESLSSMKVGLISLF